MTNKKKTVGIVIGVILIIALLMIGAYAFVQYRNSQDKQTEDESGLKVEPNLMLDETDTLPPDRVSSISVDVFKDVIAEKKEDGKYVLRLGLTNTNDFQYMITMSVGEDLIYESGLIPSGMVMEEVEVEKLDLEPGQYDMDVIFNAISDKDNQTLLGSTGVRLNLVVN